MKLKNLNRAIVAIAMMLIGILPSMAYYLKVDGIYYNIISEKDKTVEVTYKDTNLNSYSGDIVIPTNISYAGSTYTVESIGQYAFSLCTYLTSVEIPNSVSTIGDYAFYGCTGLTSVEIPNSVLTIGENAFDNCSNLKSIKIGTGVIFIGREAFYCRSLTDVYIYDLSAWMNIEYYGLDASPLGYANNLYLNDELLTDVQIPEGTTTVSDYAFWELECIESVTIPSTVKKITLDAFGDCPNLTTVTFNAENCTEMQSGAYNYNFTVFSRCSTLSTLTIGEGVKHIPDYAFSGCENLKDTLTLPASLESIGQYAFYGTSYTICKSLVTTPPALDEKSLGNIKYLYVPLESVSLYEQAEGWKDIEYIIPFGSLSLDVTNNIDGKLESVISDKTSYPAMIQELIIHGTLNSEDFKFIRENMPFLSKLDISDTDLKELPDGALRYCKELTSVEIPNSVTTIGNSAFSGCTGLTSVEIPNSVTTIGDSTFNGCSALETINFNAENCVDMGSSVGSVFSNLESFSTLNIGDNVKKIPDYAFHKCTSLANVNFGNSITSIGKSAFDSCPKLTSVSLPNSVTEIGEYVFYNCSALSNISIGNSVKTIEDWAFANCEDLKKLTINSSSVTVSENIISGCLKLVSCNIEETTQTTAKVSLESESKHDSYIYLEKTKSYYKNRDVMTGLEPTCLQNKNYGEYNYGYGLKINDTYCPVNYDYTYSRYNDIFHTKSVEADLNYSTNATSITTNVTLDAGDSTIEWYGIYDASSDIATDNKLDKVFENLDPNTLYHISFGIKIKELPSLINWSVSATTDALELTTSEAKATSTTSVRLLATTNSDATAGTGFEWRRYDSPEMVPSSVVGCPILDGILAGSLRNVDSTTYYQYRAFYTASSGNTYYGDWVGFFTGDADVYFEPDVRTFNVATVKDNNATVNGYVLDGTEEISSQGFEYWIENNASDTRGFDDAKTIEASGINMSATITDLAYNTTYIYRAFAITASGTTYGSEMKFTTDNDPTVNGVELMESEDSSFSVKLRENPATSNAWLKISGNCETNLNYTITSMTGVVVSNGSVSTDNEWNVIELTCPAGLYLLTINNDREIQTIRLIVK